METKQTFRGCVFFYENYIYSISYSGIFFLITHIMSEPGGITQSEERILSKQEIETLSSSLFEYCVTLGLSDARKIDRDKIFTASKRYFVNPDSTSWVKDNSGIKKDLQQKDEEIILALDNLEYGSPSQKQLHIDVMHVKV